MNNKLNSGDAFPRITLNLSGGGSVDLPGAPEDGYQVILFYRGSF